MPVYNVEKYVKRALLSAFNQTFESIEYLIVDDKGNDNSIDIVKELIATHPRGKDVRIIDHIVNQGTGATKNSAINEAKSEYLFFMDSDDEITPDCIELLYSKMKEKEVDLVVGSYQIKSTSKIEKMTCNQVELLGDLKLFNYIERKGYFPLATWNKLYSLQFIKSNNITCIPNHLNEDAWFSFQVMLKAKSCCFIENTTYTYYVIPNSATDFLSFTETKRKRITNQYLEIDNLKKTYSQNYKASSIYPVLICAIMRESYRYAYEISCMNPLTEKKKHIKKLFYRYNNEEIRTAIKSFLSYPADNKTLLMMKNKKSLNIVFFIFSHFPYFLQVAIIIFNRIINLRTVK